MYHLFEIHRIMKFMETEVEWWFSLAGELLFNGCRAPVWDDKKSSESGWWLWQHGNVSLHITPEMYTEEWSKRVTYVLPHTKTIFYTLTHPSCYLPDWLSCKCSTVFMWTLILWNFLLVRKVSRRPQLWILKNTLINQLFIRVKITLIFLLIPSSNMAD